MARLPIALSAHPSAWTTDAGRGAAGDRATEAVSCQFCGQTTGGWQEPFHLNDDHTDGRPENIAIACPLCHLPQHLNRPEIDQEAVLIWLPEMTQAALNILIRHIHLACDATRLPPAYDALMRMPTSALAASAPYHAYQSLYERSITADVRLGTTSPQMLAAALTGMSAGQYAQRSELLGGIRLLPTGRLFREGRDIYPQILRDWRLADRSSGAEPASGTKP